MKITKNSIFHGIIFICYFFVLVYPIFRYENFFRGNDLIANVGGFAYISEIITKYKQIPHWNFYIGTGLPTLSDPLNSYFNPLLFILYTFFEFVLATKILIGTLVFTSGISFYVLCRKFKINALVILLGSMTYMSSGYLVARLVAGHLEKLIAYSLIPILYYFIFSFREKYKKSIVPSLWIGLIFGLLLLSGSIYELMFGFIILFFTYFYTFIQTRRDIKRIFIHALFVILSFSLVAGWKLYPMVKYSQQLYKLSSPFDGSQNLLSILISFFIYVGSRFDFGNVFVQNPYRWWESFAFVGPLPLFAAIYYFFYQKNKYKVFILWLIAILCAYSMLGSPFSPFHWLFKLFPFLWNFHVPSRIFVYVIPLLLLVYLFAVSEYKKRKVILIIAMIANLAVTLIVFRKMYYSYNFMHLNRNYELLLNELKMKDDSTYYVAQSSTFDHQLPLYVAIANHQKILNPTYGYTVGGSSYIKYHAVDELKEQKYDWIFPKYFIYPDHIFPPSFFLYKPLKKIGNAILYENASYSPYVYISSQYDKAIPRIKSHKKDGLIKNIELANDEIIVQANIPDADSYLNILETNIHGWKVFVDEKEAQLINGHFLSVKGQKGKHTYRFIFDN